MALRVLLADESSTIKKVMQLALQDFGVEVKAVPIGLDVLQVARSFMPDIIFADVLLSKKNGYEVCGELKADSVVKRIPVVLMWSGFMEIDEAKAQASGADRRLEKPFDADTLRQLVKDLCPVLKTNVISEFLSFPEMPSMVEDPPAQMERPQKPPPQAQQRKSQIPGLPAAPPAANAKASIPSSTPQNRKPVVDQPHFDDENSYEELKFEASDSDSDDFKVPVIEDMEEPEEFQSVPLPKNQALAPKPKASLSNPNEDWARQDLSKYKIELPDDDDYSIDEADLTRSSIALSSGASEISLNEIDEPMQDHQTGKHSKSSAVSKTFGESPNYTAPEYGTKSYRHRLDPSTNAGSDNHSSQSSSGGSFQPSSLNALDPMRIEELLRQEARSVMESIAWKIIPEIVERVVREELQKLLKDAERL